MSYINLKIRWCDIVLDVNAPTEDKDDDIKDKFYEGLEQVFDQFPRCHMKILLGDFNAKVGKEDIFKPGRCSIANSFQFCFRILHQGSPRKLSLFGIERDISAIGLC
jgi:hypothetical protein